MYEYKDYENFDNFMNDFIPWAKNCGEYFGEVIPEAFILKLFW